MSKAGVERTCNLFHCKAGPDLYCAVPEDLAVPAFLNNDWTYAGTLRDGAEYPCGFDRNAAVIGFRLIGFHLFQTAGSTQHPNGGPDSRKISSKPAISLPLFGGLLCGEPKADELRQTIRTGPLHDVGPVKLDGPRADAKLRRDNFV